MNIYAWQWKEIVFLKPISFPIAFHLSYLFTKTVSLPCGNVTFLFDYACQPLLKVILEMTWRNSWYREHNIDKNGGVVARCSGVWNDNGHSRGRGLVTRLYVQHDQDGKEPSVLQTHSRQVNLKFLLSNLERSPAKLTASSAMIVSLVAFFCKTQRFV